MAEMNDEPDSTNERLERMLRRWGADEQAGQMQLPPAPRIVGPSRSVAAVLLRWGPLAGAAAVLAAAVTLFLVPQREPARRENRQLTAEHRRQVTAMKAKLDTAQERVDRLELDLAEQAKKHETKIALLRKDFQSQRKQLIAEAAGRVVALTKAMDKKQGELKTAEAEIARLRKDALRFSGEIERLAISAGEAESERRKVAVISRELRRVQKLHSGAVSDLQRARAEMSVFRAQYASLLNSFQDVYLSAAASGRVGLRARQLAAGRAEMLRRLSDLRVEAGNEAAGRLMDSLEVVLTRLELLDADDARAVRSFATLAGPKLIAQMDEVLAAGVASPQVRKWLLEARMILAGAGHVG